MKNEKRLQALTEKLEKARIKLAKAKNKESELRFEITKLLATQGTTKITTSNNTIFSFIPDQKNYSIPKASIPDIRNHMKEETFNEAFTTS